MYSAGTFCFFLISSTKLGPLRAANSTSFDTLCTRASSDAGGGA